MTEEIISRGLRSATRAEQTFPPSARRDTTRLILRKGGTPIGLFIAAKVVSEALINKSQQLYRRCVYRKATGAPFV